MTRHRRERGVVLLVVLFFALLLTSSIATFTRRSTVDAIVARNREAASRAEALARGGIRLGTALLTQDLVDKQQNNAPVDSHLDPWFQLRDLELPVGEDATLRLTIEDSGSLFNLNSVFNFSDAGAPYSQTEPFLQQFFEKVVDELDIPPGENLYDPADLAVALIDWVDFDDVALRGGLEDDYYQQQDPPYRAGNGPLLSVDELLLIEGFDRILVDGLRPYITVYPFVGAGGVNLNTAPPHVLALIYSNDGIDDRLARPDEVKQILTVREGGGILCGEGFNQELCTPIRSIVPNAIFPPPTYTASVFTVAAEARVGDIERRVEAVIDRSWQPPLRLSWKVR